MVTDAVLRPACSPIDIRFAAFSFPIQAHARFLSLASKRVALNGPCECRHRYVHLQHPSLGLDVVFNEDQSRAQSSHAIENLATLRRWALNLLKTDTLLAKRSIKVKIKATG